MYRRYINIYLLFIIIIIDCRVAARRHRTPAKIYLVSFWFRYARHLARLRRRRRCRAYAPTSNTARYVYGAPSNRPFGPWELRYHLHVTPLKLT